MLLRQSVFCLTIREYDHTQTSITVMVKLLHLKKNETLLVKIINIISIKIRIKYFESFIEELIEHD